MDGWQAKICHKVTQCFCFRCLFQGSQSRERGYGIGDKLQLLDMPYVTCSNQENVVMSLRDSNSKEKKGDSSPKRGAMTALERPGRGVIDE